MTSTSEMALIGSVNPGHGTAACLHYTWNDICVQMTQVYHFTGVASVEVSSPLKVLSFIYYELLSMHELQCMSLFCHEFNVWANFYNEPSSSNFILCELYSIATMNWIYNEWYWALFNVNFMKLYYCELYMNPEWHLNGCEMIWMELE